MINRPSSFLIIQSIFLPTFRLVRRTKLRIQYMFVQPSRTRVRPLPLPSGPARTTPETRPTTAVLHPAALPRSHEIRTGAKRPVGAVARNSTTTSARSPTSSKSPRTSFASRSSSTRGTSVSADSRSRAVVASGRKSNPAASRTATRTSGSTLTSLHG